MRLASTRLGGRYDGYYSLVCVQGRAKSIDLVNAVTWNAGRAFGLQEDYTYQVLYLVWNFPQSVEVLGARVLSILQDL